MKARLSVLDLSPVGGEATQAQAMRETIAVAQAAERLGYDRFWVAEHHNMRSLASASPEILMAALTQATKTIRLGSGGVMLVNYSPLKVAEVFMALEALAPGRIDLGVGRALGTDGRTGGALRSAGSEAFPQYFALLNAWLLDAGGVEPITEAHPARGIHASPSGPSHPDIFLLCSSPETADFAGRAGVGMVFAEFIARSDGAPAVSAYRAAFAPSAFRSQGWTAVATIALAAETAEEAGLRFPRGASDAEIRLWATCGEAPVALPRAFVAPSARCARPSERACPSAPLYGPALTSASVCLCLSRRVRLSAPLRASHT